MFVVFNNDFPGVINRFAFQVGKMQKQHQMLHTQEKILRYELAQKRKLLTELKEELEYSREKWTQAREKNSNTEQQWQQLRTEFASRRNTVANDNSVESGYSDDRESSSSDEEPGYETDMSECAQKVSSSDDVEDSSDMKEVTSGATILDLIEGEIVEIVCADSSSTSDVHSEQKTDSVQNQDSVEKTEECSIVFGSSVGTTQAPSLNVPEPNVEVGENSEEVACGSGGESSEAAAQITRTWEGEDKPRQSLEEVLAQRDARLRRLEGQAEQLVTKVANTADRSVVISNRLDDLHEVYGQSSSETDSPVADLVGRDDEVSSTDVNVDVRPTEDNQE